ncbi:MAG: hypothetical protein WCD35_03355 [Mycobacteriales bacterium]
MTAPRPFEGRRGNGLQAAEWGALVDLDPRLSEALLDSLAAEGVAAFVEPARDLDASTRATVLPKRPLDRLWVDPTRADQARLVVTSEIADLCALIAASEPGTSARGLVRPVPRSAASRVLPPPELPEGPTEDELFEQIVAGFSLEAPDPVPRWPVSEDVTGEATETGRPAAPPRRRRTDSQVPEVEPLPSWVEPSPVEDDGHYVPPPAPKVPRLRLRTMAAVAMLLLGLAVLFAPFQIGLDDSVLSLLLGLVLTAGGAGLLVAWMRDAPPTDSGPDDGAIV